MTQYQVELLTSDKRLLPAKRFGQSTWEDALTTYRIATSLFRHGYLKTEIIEVRLTNATSRDVLESTDWTGTV